MSALGLDDVDDPRGALAYAPQRHRRPYDDSSIRPVLERLARSEGRVPGPRMMRKAPVQELPPPDVEMIAKRAVPMTARLAIAGAVIALVGTAATGYFVLPDGDHAAPAGASASSSLPKPVPTISIQRPDQADTQPAARLVKDDARVPQVAADVTSTAGALPQSSPSMPLQATAPADPSASPLKAWAAVAAGSAAPGWSQPAQAAADQPPPQAADAAQGPTDGSSNADAVPPADKAAPAHQTHHAARHRSHHRRAARAHTAPAQAEQAAQPAETEPAQTQAVKKLPLQAAIDRLFGNRAGAAAPPPPQQ